MQKRLQKLLFQMNRILSKICGLLICLFLLNACGTTKVISGSSNADATISMKNISTTHQAATPTFNTLATRVSVQYTDDKRSQSITVSLRMEKGKHIWVKASILGITLAKILITPKRVSYYEKISRTYFDGDFALLSSWLGTDLDFEKAENILLGQSIFSMNSSEFTSMVVDNKYKIEPKIQPDQFIFSVLLNPDNFKVAKETLAQPNDQRLLTVDYSSYQKVKGDFYPLEMVINTSENNKKTRIELSYKGIDHNANVRFPFEIPSGYKEIEISK